MDKSKQSPKQINPHLNLERKFQDALKSPLYHLKSKGKVMKEINEKRKNTLEE